MRTTGFLRTLPDFAHPDHVGGHKPAQALQVRHHVSPQIRRRRVAERKDDGVALALVDVGHPPPVDLAILQSPIRFRSKHAVPPSQPGLLLAYRSVGSGALSATRCWSRISCQKAPGMTATVAG